MGRQRCSGCERPLSVCLCRHLPTPPFHTSTAIVVLQHPHEARHKLSTLSVLCKCLATCLVLQGRRFAPGFCPLLDCFASHKTSKQQQQHHALLLFPSDAASPIDIWFAHHKWQQEDRSCSQVNLSNSVMDTSGCVTTDTEHHWCILESGASHSPASSFKAPQSNHGLHDPDVVCCQMHCGSSTWESTTLQTDAFTPVASVQNPNCVRVSAASQHGDPGSCSTNGLFADPVHSAFPREGSDLPHLVLIAIDATWRHAAEMIKASAPYLSQFAIPVCLPYDAKQKGPSMAESAVILRKEPFKGCMSTLEAIASCLKVLEPNGTEIHDKLLAVLRSMVHFQSSQISSHKVRRHELKKVDINAAP